MSNEDPRDPNPIDALAVARAEIDQAVAMAPELARATMGVYRAYCEVGFTEAQALYLAAMSFKSP